LGIAFRPIHQPLHVRVQFRQFGLQRQGRFALLQCDFFLRQLVTRSLPGG
jgi:hypothetical protein